MSSFEESKYTEEDDPFAYHALEHTRLSATVAASVVGRHEEVAFSDAAWFAPQQEQHHRRPRGPPTSTLHDPPPEWTHGVVETLGPATSVDGLVSPRDARAAEKARFIEDWKRQQAAALGLPASGHADLHAVFPIQLPPAASAPKSKVAFRALPVDHATGPGFQYFPDDSPPAPESIPANVTAADVLARTVEFIPLSTAAGASAGGGGLWNRMSTWSKIQWNREGMKLEDERNARGTAEQVLYTIWKATQDKLPPPSAKAPLSAPVYRQKQTDGTTLITSNPPTRGPQVPPPPPHQHAIKHKSDKVRERNAMALQDWNVLSLHDEAIFNPYDPIQRKKKEELLAASRSRPTIWSGMTKHEKQARLNVERERMVYEDCNAAGALRKSSYRFIPRVNNRKMYSTTWGPVSFGAGAPFASMPFGPHPHPVEFGGTVPGLASAAEAWKLHHSHLSRERKAMAREDMDAKTGVRHVVPLNEWQAARAQRTKQDKEKAAMAKNEYNAIGGGSGPRCGIYTAHLGPLKFASNRGKSYALVKLPKQRTNLCPFVWGDVVNRHPIGRHREGVRYFKRTHAQMHGLIVAGQDQSTNINDQHALDGVKPNEQLGLAQVVGEALVAQAIYASQTLSHGQAYSQRARCRYRFIDAPGFMGPPPLLPLGEAYPTLPAVAPATVLLDRNNRPIKKHRSASKPAAPEDARLATNLNTSYTLIPRWNEADALFNPSVNFTKLTQLVAGASLGVLGALPPFKFDDSKPYIFDRTIPWDPVQQWRAKYGMDKHVFGSAEADIRAFPLRAKQPRFFARKPLNLRIAKRVAAHAKNALAMVPPVPKPTWKYLTQRFDEQRAEMEAMLEAQRRLQPWDPSLGAASGVHGFGQPGAFTAGGPGDVFFSPTASFQHSMGSLSSTVPVLRPVIGGALAPLAPVGKRSPLRSTQPALTPLPTIGAPTPSPFAPAPALVDPIIALEAAFEASLVVNPFRSPEQMAAVQAFLEDKKARTTAEEARVRELKDERKKTREEVNLRRKRADPSSTLDLETAAFTDRNSLGYTTVYKVPPSFGSPTAKLQSKRGHQSAPPAPFSPPPANEYRHPVFGSTSNPYSQLEAFEKWTAWNAKHAPVSFSSDQPYTFRPMPFNARTNIDTSSEDESEDDGHFRAPSPPARHKRKNEPTSATVSFSPPAVTYGSQASTRRRSRSRSKSRDAAMLKSALKGSQTLFSSEATRAEVARARSRSRGRSRSPSPDDPFAWHARATEQRQTDEIRFPPHRSSALFTNSRDRPPIFSHSGLHSGMGLPSRSPLAQTQAQPSFNTRVTPSAFASTNPLFSPSSGTTSTSTIPPPASLGQFHTGYAANGTGVAQQGFVPFNSSWPSEHTSSGSYPAPSTLSASPTKRIKAMRRERGSKRGEWDEDVLADAEELEWEAAAERDAWRREQQATQHWQRQTQQMYEDGRFTQHDQPTMRSGYRSRASSQPFHHNAPPHSSAAATASHPTSTSNPSLGSQVGSHYGGVHVNIHSPAPLAASSGTITGRIIGRSSSRHSEIHKPASDDGEESDLVHQFTQDFTRREITSKRPSQKSSQKSSRRTTPLHGNTPRPELLPEPELEPEPEAEEDQPVFDSPSSSPPLSMVGSFTPSSVGLSSSSSLSVFGRQDDLVTDMLEDARRPKPTLSSTSSAASLHSRGSAHARRTPQKEHSTRTSPLPEAKDAATDEEEVAEDEPLEPEEEDA